MYNQDTPNKNLIDIICRKILVFSPCIKDHGIWA